MTAVAILNPAPRKIGPRDELREQLFATALAVLAPELAVAQVLFTPLVAGWST